MYHSEFYEHHDEQNFVRQRVQHYSRFACGFEVPRRKPVEPIGQAGDDYYP